MSAPSASSAPSDTKGPSFVSSVSLVARREVVERARDKSFLISTGITLLIIIGAVLVPPLLGLGDRPSYDVAFSPSASGYAEPAEALARDLDVELTVQEVPADQARQAVLDDEVDAYVADDGIIVREELDDELGAVLQGANREVSADERLLDAGLDPAQVEDALAVPPIPVDPIDPPDESAELQQGIAFIGTFVLYGQLLGYGFWVAAGVVEEKSSRVVEVLLATVRPRALLAGKVLGVGLLGLGQLLLVAAVGLGLAQATGVISLGSEALLPVALVLGWFVLGFAFYACLFAAAAARVSRQEDLQSVTTPGTMLVLISFFAAFYANAQPDATASRVLAVLPPFSALVNPVRTAGGDAAIWELLLAVVLMLAAVAALVVIAARVYEGAVLRMGSTVGFRDAWRSRGRTSAAR